MPESPDRLIERIGQRMRAAESVETALLAAIETTCLGCQLPYGEAWTSYTERPVLYMRVAWHQPELELGPFIAATRKLALARGVGTPGRIWQSRRPEIVDDLRSAPGFSRQKLAIAAGFRAVIGAPVMDDDQVRAVLLYFLFDRRPGLGGVIGQTAAATGAALKGFMRDRPGGPSAWMATPLAA